MSNTFHLKQLRARWGLNQEELASLLGISQASVSRYEKNEDLPTLIAALGLQVIFNRQPRSLFRDLYEHIEEAVMRRAAELERNIGDTRNYTSLKKRQLLEAMVARATSPDEA